MRLNFGVIAALLAGGKGTRMKSDLPKVLHRISGKPMIEYVIDSVLKAGVEHLCIVVGGDLEAFKELMTANREHASFVEQKNRKGTADALASVAVLLDGVKAPIYAESNNLSGRTIHADWILVTAADTPAISSQEIRNFMHFTKSNSWDLCVLAMKLDDPKGYGRIKTDSFGNVLKIVEEKDASESEKKIVLCNTGIWMGRISVFFELLQSINNKNAQSEYYLTDVAEIAQKQSRKVGYFVARDSSRFQGVNDPEQLANIVTLMT